MSSEMLEGVFVSSGEAGFCLPPPQQNTCMPLQVYAIDVDITETMGDLLARAGEALTLDLTHHRVTVLGERQLDIQDTLQDQCGTRTGRVQVQFVILPGMEKEEENRRGVLDIVDVLKSSEEEPSQEERIKEGVSLPTSPPEKSKPTRWIVSTEFREIQKALKMPRDPRKWSSSHVRVWLVWARQHFPEVGPYQNHHRDLDGAQMMSLTPSQLQQRHVLVTSTNNEPSTDLFLTHRDLLRQTGAAAVCEQPPAPPHSIQQQIAQVTSRSENVQRSTTATAANATGSQPIQLWQFLLELLTEPKLVKVISWWGSGVSGEFRLHQPEVVASLWGHRKGRPNMTYDKLSRALRYYYEGDMIAKVAGKRFVYRFVLDLKVVVGYSAAELKAQIEQCIQNG